MLAIVTDDMLYSKAVATWSYTYM